MQHLSPSGKLILCALGAFVVGSGVGRWTANSAPTPLARVIESSSASSTGNVLGQGQSPRIALDGDVDFAAFWDVWSALKTKYYKQPIADKDLYYGALQGLVAGAGDPYTIYFPPKEAQAFADQLDGVFEGIGAQIDVKNGLLTVISPLPGSPAEKAGLRPDDVIVSIDTKPTDGMTVDQAAETIRGPKGTAVTIGVLRKATSAKPFNLTIVRDEIRIKSVILTWKPGNIADVQITGFNNDSADLFLQAAQEIQAKKAKGIILDLRGNPGGLVLSAQSVAGAWVGDQVIFKQRRQGKIMEEVHGIGHAELGTIPTVILEDQGSASASEIVAGALQDYGKATTIGKKTFGKGSEQEYENLKDGSALKITIAEWLTPKDRAINHVGLDPMIVVDRTKEDYDAKRDPQLERAQQFLKGGGAASSVSVSTTSTRP